MKTAICLSLIFTLSWTAITIPLTTYSADFARQWDHHQYIEMAQGKSTVAPYAYRVLTPFLARALPFDLQTNFRLLAFLVLWGTGIAVYALARAFDFAPTVALIGTALFYTLYWAVGFTSYDFWLCDPLVFLLAVLAIRSAKLRQGKQFAALLALGVLNKETALCVVPLWFTLNPDAKREGLLGLLPSGVVLIGLHLFIQITPSEYNLFSTFREMTAWRLQTFNLDTLWRVTFGTFGILLIIPWFSKSNLRHLAIFAPYLALIYAQLLIANNTERLLVLAFPALIVMSLETIQGYTIKRRGVSLSPA